MMKTIDIIMMVELTLTLLLPVGGLTLDPDRLIVPDVDSIIDAKLHKVSLANSSDGLMYSRIHEVTDP